MFLAVLDRAQFHVALKKKMQKSRQKLVDFLSKLACFKGMKKTNIDKFSNFLTEMKFTRG